MRKLLTLAAAMFLSGSLYAEGAELFLVFDFMKVEEGKYDAYLETEEFWSGIHKQRVLADEMVGWDLWALQPAGSEQGAQFLTVNLYDNLETMMQGVSVESLRAHAVKAYPDLSAEEIAARLDATADNRELGWQVYLKEIDTTTGGPEMKVGTVALITAMKAKEQGYERAESEIFKPWHQRMVDEGAKSSWGLLRVLFPAGDDRYASHIVYSMFEDVAQYVKARDYEGPESDLLTDLSVQKGLETRDLRKVTFATLIKMVRK